jgi:hypothetical protein
MSAPKRTRQQKAIWLQPSEILEPEPGFREKVLAYPAAKLALSKITGPVLTEELVWDALWQMACRASERKVRAASWYLVPGFSLSKLRRFPKQVRGWAAEIETLAKRIQSHRVYGSTAHGLPQFLELQRSARRFSAKRTLPEALTRRLEGQLADLAQLAELPELLRFYADAMEAVFRLTAAFASKAPSRYKANLVWAFIDCVVRVTGKPHFSDIANLLTAACHAKGSDKIWYAHNLKMQYVRYSPVKVTP